MLQREEKKFPLKMKKFAEICFAILYLTEIAMIHNVSGEFRELFNSVSL